MSSRRYLHERPYSPTSVHLSPPLPPSFSPKERPSREHPDRSSSTLLPRCRLPLDLLGLPRTLCPRTCSPERVLQGVLRPRRRRSSFVSGRWSSGPPVTTVVSVQTKTLSPSPEFRPRGLGSWCPLFLVVRPTSVCRIFSSPSPSGLRCIGEKFEGLEVSLTEPLFRTVGRESSVLRHET